MSDSKWKMKVPGKLMIAGEYAVLEPNQHAVVAAVDRYITANIERSNENTLSLPQLGLDHITWRNDGADVVFMSSDARLKFIEQAMLVSNQFLREQSVSQGPYRLSISSDLADDEGRKYGLGSSAAIVVAVVAAILSLNRVQLSKEQIFKLSAIAHLQGQGNGSGADIAASVFGGWIQYSSFRPSWVVSTLNEGMRISELMAAPWPNLSIAPLTPPPQLELCVGWTEEIAGTGPMVQQIQTQRFKKPLLFERFLEESSEAVTRLVKGFRNSNYAEAVAGITQNRHALRKLGEAFDVSIETPKLKKLCEIGEEFGSAKSSGAGGGDCGIAFTNGNHRSRLYQAWRNEGIQPLPMRVAKDGFSVSTLSFPCCL